MPCACEPWPCPSDIPHSVHLYMHTQTCLAPGRAPANKRMMSTPGHTLLHACR